MKFYLAILLLIGAIGGWCVGNVVVFSIKWHAKKAAMEVCQRGEHGR